MFRRYFAGQIKRFCAIACSIFVVACSISPSPTLTLTPTLYLKQDYPADSIPVSLQTTKAELFFVTDRSVADKTATAKKYSSDRSRAMTFGAVTVSFRGQEDWAKLVEVSNTDDRSKDIKLEITKNERLVKFPKTPLLFTKDDDQRIALQNDDYREYQEDEKIFKNTLFDLLNKANRKEVVLYVHGINNDFEDAAYTMSDVWHFSGRIGVPIFFTWPAGAGGLLGYLRDRESGEYSIYHLKETLRLISETKNVQKVHIIAHSRGADVVTTAMRELIIEQRGEQVSARDKYKIANLILAAPDLDFGVARQRLIAERFEQAFGNVNIYVNQKDSALKVAQRFMAGQRTGQISIDDLKHIDREIYGRVKNIHFINVESAGGNTSHNYFRQNQNVLSDIALTLQTSAKPGTKERPLLPLSGNFWRLTEYYPFDVRPKGYGEPVVLNRAGN